MNIKPSDFFIGVTEFFSVIMPGALVSFFLGGLLYTQLFNGEVLPVLRTSAENWIVFLFATYLTGSLLFGMASWLDKWVYHPFLRKFFTRNHDLSFKIATALREQFIPMNNWLRRLSRDRMISTRNYEIISSKNNPAIINTYKWCLYVLECTQPHSLPDIRRVEADSKFFRSLVPAFLLIGIYLLIAGNLVVALAAITLSVFCLYRYGDLRYKANEKACELVITLTHRKRKSGKMEMEIPSGNESSFPASLQTRVKHENMVSHLLAGGTKETGLYEIAESQTWRRAVSTQEEDLYCINGHSVVLENQSGSENKLVLSKGGILRLKKNASYVMENRQSDPLVLLTFQ